MKIALKTLFGMAIISLALASFGYTAESPGTGLIRVTLIEDILAEVSGERVLDHVYELIRFDRITGSLAYDQAAEYILTKLGECGVTDAKIEAFPPEWKASYFTRNKPTWWPPMGWSVKRAVLKVIDPEEKIADYDEEPIVLARMSRSFRGRAELVYVGLGTRDEDYVGKNVAGKIVLARGSAGAVHNRAVIQKGAVGVLSFGPAGYNKYKGRGYPEMVVWQVLSPVENEAGKPQYAFSLSEEKGRHLLSLLRQKERVEVEVEVETEFYPNDLKIVSALIPGKGKGNEEFLFYAHLDHVRPSAGDNASGCAVLLETARVITRLIREGRIPQPQRSIRFVWGPEGPGSLMYINAHYERLKSTLAGLNLDMVGQDGEKTGSILRIIRPPDSLPSFMTDLIQNLIEDMDRRLIKAPTGKRGFMNYRFMPFSASSDHYYFNDGAIKVPMLMLNHSPDSFHHVNIDTPDKLDATELKRTAYLAAAAALFVAGADDGDAHHLALMVSANGAARIMRSTRKGLALLQKGSADDLGEQYRAGSDYLRFTAKREIGAVRSTERLKENSEIGTDEMVKSCLAARDVAQSILESAFRKKCSDLGLEPKKPMLSKAEEKAADLVPERTGRYLNLNWRFILSEQDLKKREQDFIESFSQEFMDSYIRIPEILNFIDGRNSLLEIRDAVSSEYFGFMTSSGYVGHSENISSAYRLLKTEDLLQLMGIFKKAGLVDF